MAWLESGDGWKHDDDQRHLLLHKRGWLAELDGGFVHLYEQEPGATFDPESPLAGAHFSVTHERPDLARLDEAAVWRELAAYL